MASAASSHDFFKDRFERTVRCSLPTGGAPYSRGDFVLHLRETVGCKALEAIGPTSRGNVWELTFASKHDKTQFLDAGEFAIRGHTCTVSDLQKTRYRVRAHWMPYFLPNDVVGNDLVANGCKIVTVLYDKTSVDELKHCSSNLRTFIVETDQPTRIPHFVYWNGMGMGGRVMLTMTGRRPTCLRCSLPGHIRKNCETKFCRRCKRYGHELDNCTGGSWAGAARQGPDQAEGDLIDEDDDSLFDEALSSRLPPQPSDPPRPPAPHNADEQPSGSGAAPPPSSSPDAVDDVTPAPAPTPAPRRVGVDAMQVVNPPQPHHDAADDATPASAPSSAPLRVMVDAVQAGETVVLLNEDFPPLSPSSPSLTRSSSSPALHRSPTIPPRPPPPSAPLKAASTTLTPPKAALTPPKVTEKEVNKGPIVVTKMKKKGDKDSQAGGDMAAGDVRRRRRGGLGAAGGAPDDEEPFVRKPTNPEKLGGRPKDGAPADK